MLNLLPIDELEKGALVMVEPRYEAHAEHAGIHDNPKSGNYQAPSHLRGKNGTQGKLHILTQLVSKHTSPVKPHTRPDHALLL